MFKSFLALILGGLCGDLALAGHGSLLQEIETKYQSTPGIQMNVSKKLKIELLGKEKLSEGMIKIKKGGNFKWEIQKPDHQIVLLEPKGIWVVDYPADPTEKVSVLKSKRPKKNQSPAVVAFLMGKGELTKKFKTIKSNDDGKILKITLEARSEKEMVKVLDLELDREQKLIKKISFKDAMGNQTELEFSDVKFNVNFDKKEFEFTTPPNSSVSSLD